jgi:hypothetical protein
MVLLVAVFAGILIGITYARWKGEKWSPPFFQATWLVFLGFLPQLLTIYIPVTREYFSDRLASASLIFSLLLLLIFAIVNRRLPGMYLLMLGLGANLLAILANGGFMPLSLETASKLWEQPALATLKIGERISSGSKDILLLREQIVFPWLADRFLPPDFLSYRFAYSLGDIFISIGAFYMLVKK